GRYLVTQGRPVTGPPLPGFRTWEWPPDRARYSCCTSNVFRCGKLNSLSRSSVQARPSNTWLSSEMATGWPVTAFSVTSKRDQDDASSVRQAARCGGDVLAATSGDRFGPLDSARANALTPCIRSLRFL